MKKIIAILLILLIVFCFIGCHLSHDTSSKREEQTESTTSITLQDNTKNTTKTTTDHQAKEAVLVEKLIDDANQLARGYYYDEAIKKLEQSTIKAEQIEHAIAKIKQDKDLLVPYEGKVYHVFFHSLIIDTNKAFDNIGHPANGYNLWMTTQSEFKKMLPEMLARGFVLYNINDLVHFDENGKAIKQPIMLPKGKKPLILSIDDVSYYDYMKKDGFAKCLVVNDKGDVVTLVESKDGTLIETYDGDVMPILDTFVKEHPEFSYRGAKGIIALTGYQGIFGYRMTDLKDYSKEEGDNMLRAVKDIAKRLKENGWLFASHSYTHNSYFRDGSITMRQLKYETQRWQKKIEPHLGNVNIFISPFGMGLKASDPRFKYLVSQGFNIYCPVGASMKTIYASNGLIQGRLNLDGATMLGAPKLVEPFFDVEQVIDKSRPPLR